MSDLGLYGPDSVTWRVHADPVMGLGGLRALHLQALHPLAMAGVAQHSDFRADPWGRLFRTVDYVTATTFGTTAEAQRQGARVRGLHRGLAGVEPETEQRYRVDDPQLLRWVHCCLIDSFLSTFQRAGGGLTKDETDSYVLEQRRNARLVGLHDEDVPATAAELSAYFVSVRPQLLATEEAKRAARFVLWPPMPSPRLTAAKPLWTGVSGLGFALLPRWARRLYGSPALPTTDAAATVTLRALRLSLLALPANVREGPPVRAARARAAALTA